MWELELPTRTCWWGGWGAVWGEGGKPGGMPGGSEVQQGVDGGGGAGDRGEVGSGWYGMLVVSPIPHNLCPVDDHAPDPHTERLFYRRATGERLDAIRNRIAEWQADGAIDATAAACLLAPLLYQASWLANTSGVFKGFHAGWGGRSGTALHRILADLRLSPLQFLDTGRRHTVHHADAMTLAGELPHAEVVYLDPPYNQHPYASNYHVLNSLVLWDRPELPPPTARGQKAAIRADWKARRSPFNHRPLAVSAYVELLQRVRADVVLSSYSTDGTIPVEALVAANAPFGALDVHCRRYQRYRTSPTRPSPRPTNVEFVLACDRRQTPRQGDAERVLAAIAATGEQGRFVADAVADQGDPAA